MKNFFFFTGEEGTDGPWHITDGDSFSQGTLPLVYHNPFKDVSGGASFNIEGP